MSLCCVFLYPTIIPICISHVSGMPVPNQLSKSSRCLVIVLRCGDVPHRPVTHIVSCRKITLIKIYKKESEQAGAELCQAQGQIKLANFGSFCLICLVLFGSKVAKASQELHLGTIPVRVGWGGKHLVIMLSQFN